MLPQTCGKGNRHYLVAKVMLTGQELLTKYLEISIAEDKTRGKVAENLMSDMELSLRNQSVQK